MKQQTKGVMAGAAGAVLLLGGSTFMLWSDSATVPGAEIASGNLDLTFEAPAWYDVSGDRTDSPHSIDLDSFMIIPGDTIEGHYEVGLDLAGENLVAEFGLVYGAAASGDLLDGLDIEYSIVDADDTVLATGMNGVTALFASADNGNPGALDVVDAAGTTVTVVVSVTFDAATADQDLTESLATLSAATLELNQVRSAAHGY